MSDTTTFAWHGLPDELKLTVLEKLTLHDVLACGKADRKSYAVCVPILFRTVKLPSYESLQSFLNTVPPEYRAYIHDLDVCTKSSSDDSYLRDTFTPYEPPHVTQLLATLFSRCVSLETLSMSVGGSLVPDVILDSFRKLERVKKLKLENWEREEIRPFSERLAVSLAFSLPRLEDLTLVRITRSALHAEDLAFTSVPVITGDDDDTVITPHAVLGRELRLPQFLRLPNLRRLKIRDTHLGDKLWGQLGIPECPLEVLDLGACAYVSPQENEAYTARILASAPASVKDVSLSSSLAASPARTGNAIPKDENSESQQPALPYLRTLHLTPLVPTSSLSSTLAQPTLAGSPVQTLSCAFDVNDAAEGCAALEAFLRERSERELSRRPQHGRKRSGSKLAICETLTEEPESSPIVDSVKADDSNSKSEILDQEQLTTTRSSGEAAELTPLYPALRTLSIEIPDAMDALQSPTGKLSPRRLAAARRRAEERLNAARRLRTLATQLGLEVVVRGIDGLSPDSTDKLTDLPGVPAAKPCTRTRANSTL